MNKLLLNTKTILLFFTTNIFCMQPKPNPQKKLFLCIGLPGSGKTTVTQKIAEKHNSTMAHQSVGDLLRAEAKSDTEQGRTINNLISQGKLVPFETTLNIIGDYLSKNKKPIIILDGYQGTKDYIEPFHELLKRHNIKLAKVLSFDVETNTAIARCQARTRTDDKPEALKSRMEIRLKNLKDIQEYYAARGLLVRINGNNPLERVVEETERSILEV